MKLGLEDKLGISMGNRLISHTYKYVHMHVSKLMISSFSTSVFIKEGGHSFELKFTWSDLSYLLILIP